MPLRIITTFSNPHLIVRHDTAAGGAVHPETGEAIVSLGEFLRRLHAQRAVHQATGTPYSIRQELRPLLSGCRVEERHVTSAQSEKSAET